MIFIVISNTSVICLCVVVHGSVSMTQHIVISNLTSTSASAVPDLELQVAFLPDPRPRPQPESSAKTANVMANKEEVDSGTPKTVQYTWRGLRMVGEPSLFDLDEPTWHPDEKSPICDRCRAQFTLLVRRHHCRRCGDVVCGECCEKNSLSRMGYVDPVLVCNKCLPTVRSEEEFMSTHLKLLVHGAHFNLSDSPDPLIVYHCKLSTDHKQIIISDHLPINMKHILEVKTISDEEPPKEGTRKRSSSSSKHIGLELTYKTKGNEQKLRITPAPSHSRKHGNDWLRALKKGLIILNR